MSDDLRDDHPANAEYPYNYNNRMLLRDYSVVFIIGLVVGAVIL